MASKKTLNAKNLQALGAEHLARLLIEISAGNPAAKRRLRLELAGAHGAGDAAKEIRKRLATIGRSRSFIDWHNRKELIADLETQRRAIVDIVAKSDPEEALDLMWRFLELANSVFDRCDDSTGTVIEVFHEACGELGEIAEVNRTDSQALAERAFNALTENNYGQLDTLIEDLSPALGNSGLDHLKSRFVELSETPLPKPSDDEREVIAWSSQGPFYADDYAEQQRDSAVQIALQEIADLQGDVDGFIAQNSERAKTVPTVAAEIARRLLAAGRAEEAWSAINAVEEDRPGWIPFEWEKVRTDVLDALGRHEEAQAFRWTCFERSLNDTHLRNFLKRLPDFDDLEAEERALSYALEYPNMHQALAFLVLWPALDKATQLVLSRAAELDGYHYEILTPAADALDASQPLAVTILRRALIDFALDNARVKRYRHAARHLVECERLAARIDDFGTLENHATYVTGLKAQHGRKSSFWSLVS